MCWILSKFFALNEKTVRGSIRWFAKRRGNFSRPILKWFCPFSELLVIISLINLQTVVTLPNYARFYYIFNSKIVGFWKRNFQVITFFGFCLLSYISLDNAKFPTKWNIISRKIEINVLVNDRKLEIHLRTSASFD